MPDLRHSLESAAPAVDVDAAWSATLGRVTQRRKQRQFAAGVAAAVALAIAVVGMTAFRSDAPAPQQVISGPDTSVPVAPAPESGWQSLPPLPSGPRPQATIVAGADEVLVWGGLGNLSEGDGSGRQGVRDGWIYSFRSGAWRSTGPAPIVGRRNAVGVWTGREYIVWGGNHDRPHPEPDPNDGAAFDPASGTWRTMAPWPAIGRYPEDAVRGGQSVAWTGADFVVAATREGAPLETWAYEPEADAWRRLPDRPGPVRFPRLLAAGDQLVQWSRIVRAPGDQQLPPEEQASNAKLAADLLSDERGAWRPAAPVDAPISAVHAAAEGATVTVAVTGHGDGRAWRYDVLSDRWASLPALAVEAPPATDQTLFLITCNGTTYSARQVLRPGDGASRGELRVDALQDSAPAWSRLPVLPLEPRDDLHAACVEGRLAVFAATAGTLATFRP